MPAKAAAGSPSHRQGICAAASAASACCCASLVAAAAPPAPFLTSAAANNTTSSIPALTAVTATGVGGPGSVYASLHHITGKPVDAKPDADVHATASIKLTAKQGRMTPTAVLQSAGRQIPPPLVPWAARECSEPLPLLLPPPPPAPHRRSVDCHCWTPSLCDS